MLLKYYFDILKDRGSPMNTLKTITLLALLSLSACVVPYEYGQDRTINNTTVYRNRPIPAPWYYHPNRHDHDDWDHPDHHDNGWHHNH